MPNFYDVSSLESTKILEGNCVVIKKFDFYNTNEDKFKPNFTPYNYKEDGWRTINLFAFMMEYPEAIKNFPIIDSIEKNSHLLTAQITVL